MSAAVNPSEVVQNKTKISEDQPKASTPVPQEEEYTIVLPRRKHETINDDEPLIDTTAALTLHSKRTTRLEKRRNRKSKKSTPTTLLDLPPEILLQILTHLPPTSLLPLYRLSRPFNTFLTHHESHLTTQILRVRYPILNATFPLPTPLSRLPLSSITTLQSPTWQSKLALHTHYTHLPRAPADQICTCTTCTLAWNNLVLALDLAHFQPYFDARKPLPVVPRGRDEEWNLALKERWKGIVLGALERPLWYAVVLERYLGCVVGMLERVRRYASRVKGRVVEETEGGGGEVRKGDGKDGEVPYGFTVEDARAGMDAFLARKGRMSLEFPYVRDRYHYLVAYVPNRRWNKEEERWQYFDAKKMHERDLAFIMSRFSSGRTTQ